MASRFWTEREENPISKFVPLPLDFLQKQLEVKQQKYDEVKGKQQEAEGLLASIQGGTFTQKFANDIKKDYLPKLEKLNQRLYTEKDPNIAREIYSTVNQIKNDPRFNAIQRDLTGESQDYRRRLTEKGYQQDTDFNRDANGNIIQWTDPTESLKEIVAHQSLADKTNEYLGKIKESVIPLVNDSNFAYFDTMDIGDNGQQVLVAVNIDGSIKQITDTELRAAYDAIKNNALSKDEELGYYLDRYERHKGLQDDNIINQNINQKVLKAFNDYKDLYKKKEEDWRRSMQFVKETGKNTGNGFGNSPISYEQLQSSIMPDEFTTIPTSEDGDHFFDEYNNKNWIKTLANLISGQNKTVNEYEDIKTAVSNENIQQRFPGINNIVLDKENKLKPEFIETNFKDKEGNIDYEKQWKAVSDAYDNEKVRLGTLQETYLKTNVDWSDDIKRTFVGQVVDGSPKLTLEGTIQKKEGNKFKESESTKTFVNETLGNDDNKNAFLNSFAVKGLANPDAPNSESARTIHFSAQENKNGDNKDFKWIMPKNTAYGIVADKYQEAFSTKYQVGGGEKIIPGFPIVIKDKNGVLMKTEIPILISKYDYKTKKYDIKGLTKDLETFPVDEQMLHYWYENLQNRNISQTKGITEQGEVIDKSKREIQINNGK